MHECGAPPANDLDPNAAGIRLSRPSRTVTAPRIANAHCTKKNRVAKLLQTANAEFKGGVLDSAPIARWGGGRQVPWGVTLGGGRGEL